MKKLFAIIVVIALACMMISIPATASERVDVFPEGAGDGGPQQLNSGGPIAVVFTVPEGNYCYELIGLASPTWTQAVGCDAAVEVYSWTGDYDESIEGEILATGEVLEHQDNQDAVFTLDKDLMAGTYLAEFTATGSGAFGFWTFGEAGENDYVFQNGAEVMFFPKLAMRIAEVGNDHDPVEPRSIVLASQYSDSFKLNADNAKTWTGGDIGETSVNYYLTFEGDFLKVGVVAKGVNEGDMIQLNFNPDNKLAATTGLFVSFKLGETLTVLQHNHKTALLDNDSAGGADISDKVESEIVKMSTGYEFIAKLPADLFKITDVEGADSYEFGSDPLYFGMFIVTGSNGYTNQSAAPGDSWTCDGLGLTEYSIVDPLKDKTVFYLYDPAFGVSTGWWLHPVGEDSAVTVEFTSDVWFNAIDFYAYASPVEVQMIVSLEDSNGNEVFTTDVTCKDNKNYIIDLLKSFGPDSYVLNFIGGDMSEVEEDNWFVLGSAPLNESIDEVLVYGGATNETTKDAPFISMAIAEPDPNATEKPTKEPATPAPTEAPATDAPVAPTAVPTDDKPSEGNEPTSDTKVDPTKAPDKTGGPNIGLIIGIIAAGVVLVAAIVAIIVAATKKKKK